MGRKLGISSTKSSYRSEFNPFCGNFDWFSDKWRNNEIDNFIKGKLDENDLKRSPEAEKRQLARRAALDLVGIPATEKLVTEFMNNNS